MTAVQPKVRIVCGDALDLLAQEPAGSSNCCVTSPPYWGLRDYGITPSIWGGDPSCDHRWVGKHITAESTESVRWQHRDGGGGHNRHQQAGMDPDDLRVRGQVPQATCEACGAWRGCLGLEPSCDMYVDHLVAVFREVGRALSADGTLWLNLGDSYAHPGSGGNGATGGRDKSTLVGQMPPIGTTPVKRHMPTDLRAKNLIGIPWRVAFALQADGWLLRSDIIWAKANPMPESVTDRPTRAHEYVFLLTRAPRYYYDADAIRERAKGGVYKIPAGRDAGEGPHQKLRGRYSTDKQRGHSRRHAGFNARWDAMPRAEQMANGRNARSVWEIAPQPFREAHFATFPEELARRCILAGCPEGGTVLDPFGGSGTVGMVAARYGRNAVLFDLNPDYCAMARRRVWPETQPRMDLGAVQS